SILSIPSSRFRLSNKLVKHRFPPKPTGALLSSTSHTRSGLALRKSFTRHTLLSRGPRTALFSRRHIVAVTRLEPSQSGGSGVQWWHTQARLHIPSGARYGGRVRCQFEALT